MRAGIAVVVSVLVVAGATAPAVAEPGLRWGAELEYGALVSRPSGERRDMAGLATFQLRAVIVPATRWELALGLGVPQPIPALSLQVPVTLHYRPLRALRVHAGARWIYAWAGLCAEAPEQCPMQEALQDPYDRGGSIVGWAGELGASYQWPITSGLALRLAGGYLRGWFVGRATASETTLGGLYQGGVLSFGIVTR